MAVGLKLGSITDEIGTSDFFHAFFSTVSGNLETGGWGSRFPIVMDKLYQGELQQSDAIAALAEIKEIEFELSKLPVDRVIWDIEDQTKTPPWGDNIADTITDLSNYFVTSTGRDLIPLLIEMIEELRDRGGEIKVVSY